jgi:hypothetical protein
VNLARVIDLAGGLLTEHRIRWAVCEGLGMAAYGLARTTFDVDLVADGDKLDEVMALMEGNGFETLYRSRGFSNHLHPDRDLGRVDIVYIRDRTREQLFAAAREVPGPGGRTLLAPKPEHLAALKVAAMASDPGHTFQELDDIRFLLTLPGVDRDEVRRFFARHGLEGRYEEVVATL